MITAVSYDDVACTIQSDAVGTIELSRAFAFAADGAQANAIAETNHLQAMIVFVSDNNIALVVQCYQPRMFELPVGSTFAAEGAQKPWTTGGDAANGG